MTWTPDFSPPRPWQAACMDAAEWADWRRLEDVRPCAACPIAFAIVMRAEHRCNGIPHSDLPGVAGRPLALSPEERIARRRRSWRESQRRRRRAAA